MADQKSLETVVNGSGFAFQLGVERWIRSDEQRHGWRVMSREHPWQEDGGTGFIDLVLGSGLKMAVLECKRSREGGAWVFLVPENEDEQRKSVRAGWVGSRGAGVPVTRVDGFEMEPASYVSSFCAVRGSGEDHRPLLERICGMLVRSTDCLANEDLNIELNQGRIRTLFYLPIVVTNTELHVCRFDPARVDPGTGVPPAMAFETVPWIRFRKSFSMVLYGSKDVSDLEDAARVHTRTVMIVNANHLVTLLAKINETDLKVDAPWITAEKELRV